MHYRLVKPAAHQQKGMLALYMLWIYAHLTDPDLGTGSTIDGGLNVPAVIAVGFSSTRL